MTARDYTFPMDSGHFRARTLALVAAYAVAMQALLSAFIPVGPVVLAAPLSVLCSHGSADGSDSPAPQHDLPCTAICAALGHGIAGPMPPEVAVPITTPNAIASLGPVVAWIAPHIFVRLPQIPRGPPFA
jgi:hypothetical protein